MQATFGTEKIGQGFVSRGWRLVDATRKPFGGQQGITPVDLLHLAICIRLQDDDAGIIAQNKDVRVCKAGTDDSELRAVLIFHGKDLVKAKFYTQGKLVMLW